MIHLFPPPEIRRNHRAGRQVEREPSRAMCKAAAAVAVAEGHLSSAEACGLCGMDPEELEVWQHVVRDHGLRRMFAGRI
jgi:hypothetical protein